MIKWFMKLSITKRLALTAGLLAVLALIIGNTPQHNITVNAKELALSGMNQKNKISPTQLADWVIKGNGDYTLVDLRSEKEYNDYAIPNSINIKMSELLNSGLLRNEKILLFGSDDITSAQAWFILKSAGYKGVYILKGGMNSWKNDILFPQYILGSSKEDSLKFEGIKQVCLHFGGTPRIVSAGGTVSSVNIETKISAPTAPKLTAPQGTPVKKKKEGC